MSVAGLRNRFSTFYKLAATPNAGGFYALRDVLVERAVELINNGR